MKTNKTGRHIQETLRPKAKYYAGDILTDLLSKYVLRTQTKKETGHTNHGSKNEQLYERWQTKI